MKSAVGADHGGLEMDSTISGSNKALRAFVAGGNCPGAEGSLPAKDDVDGGKLRKTFSIAGGVVANGG